MTLEYVRVRQFVISQRKRARAMGPKYVKNNHIYRQKRLFKIVTGVSDVTHSMSNSYCYSNIVITTLIQYSKVWYCSNQLRPDQNMLICRPWHLPCRFYNNPDISWEKHCLWANDYLSKLHHTHWLVTNKIATFPKWGQ